MEISGNTVMLAGNWTMSVWLATLSIIAFITAATRLRNSSLDIRLMTIGLGVEAGGWTFFTAYWGTVRYLADHGYPSIYADLATYWWPQLTTLSISMLGIILIMSPMWKAIIGAHWKWVPTALVLSTFWFFYWYAFVPPEPETPKTIVPPPTRKP